VKPRSKRAKIDWTANGALAIWVTAAPVNGEANRAVCTAVAELLDVSRTSVQVAAGHSSRSKKLKVLELDQQELDRRVRVKLGPRILEGLD